MKKHFTLLLVVIALSMQSYAATNTKIGSLYYKLDADKKTAAVASQNKTSPYWTTSITSANIPSSVKYSGTTYSVTSIGDHAFHNCTGLTSVAIPNSVTSIGESAFHGCTGLTSMTIPNSVKDIGYLAFAGCSGLTSVSIGNSVTSIGDNAFDNCTGLTSIEIPNSVTSIGGFAFEDCTGLTSVTMPDSVIQIGSYPFYNCTGLPVENHLRYADTYLVEVVDKTQSTYTIKEGTKWIGNFVFSSCTDLTSIEIPNSVTSIGMCAFDDCTSLISVTIGNGVTSIEASAFRKCRGLTSVSIPNSVTSVGNNAFSNCSGLTSVTIGNSVTTIGNYAFYNCTRLTTFTIGNGVTSIGTHALENCSSLRKIIFGENLISIGNDALKGCTSLDTVVWNAKNYAISSKDNTPFYYYESSSSSSNWDIRSQIMSFTFGAHVETIPKYLCYKMSGITTTTIPKSVKSIGNSAFADCTSNKIVFNHSALNIVKGATNNGYVARYASDVYTGTDTIGDFVFAKSADDDYLAAYLGLDCQITLPTNYRGGSYGIGSYLFRNNTIVNSITIPNSVTSIGEYAFNGCSNLNVVYIGNSVISIGQAAFTNCPLLYKIIMLPNTVPTGINDAFQTLPGRITYVGNTNYQSGYDVLGTQRVYSNLNSYFSVDGVVYALLNPSQRTCDIIDCDYSGATTEFSIGNSVVYRNVTLTVDSINSHAFRNNQKMTKLNIDYDHALPSHMASYCSSLTNVVINNLSDIGKYAFYESAKNEPSKFIINNTGNISDSAFAKCASIDTMVITSNVKNIGTNAFSDCSKNENAYYYINNSGNISAYAFARCSKLNNLIITDSVKDIGNQAFRSCGIAHADIYNNGGIGTEAFRGSSTLNATFHIHNSGAISDYAFAACSSMTHLVIDSCVTTIGQYAFQNCGSLEDATIKNNGNIGAYAFQNCTSLEDVTIKNNGSIGNNAFEGSSTGNHATYYINNVGSINNSAFANCTSVRNLTIDSCITSIGQYAFQNCSSLKDVTIKNHGNIGGSAFKGSSTGTPATYLISNVGSISSSAFANCSSIKNLTIDSCVTTIGQYAFQNCSSLEDVTINNKGNIGGSAFESASTGNPATYIISNVGSISASAFANCSALHKVRLGNQVSKVEGSAFSNCVLLDSITLPNTVTSLGSSAFYNCQSLAYIKLSNQLSSIGQSTFANCSSLSEIFIPKSVNSIGNSAFQQCASLSIVSFEDSTSPLSLGRDSENKGLFYDCTLDSLYIGRELTYQKSEVSGYSPFYRNPSLRSIVISNLPTQVETNEFYGCTSLNSVFIGNGVQSIGDYAFSGCSSIDYFSFGSQVQSIGAEAFSDCVSMTRLYSYCQVPPTCGASALEDIDKWNCTLYIPEGTTNDYAAAEQWRDFFFVEENEEGSDGTKFTISVDFDASKGNVTGAGVYDRGTEVVLIATPAEGCIFVEWEDGSTDPERHISVFKSATYTATFSSPTVVETLNEDVSTGVVYDVLGRPVSHPSHGIFIRNGEKILVK